MGRKNLTALFLANIITCSSVVMAQDQNGNIEIELISSWEEKNTIQIPNDPSSSRFSATDIEVGGSLWQIRLNGTYELNEQHAIRLVLSPFSYTKTGQFDSAINFAGQGFSSSAPVTIDYKFNSWRLGYRYHHHSDDRSDLWLGITAKIRDAKVELRQGSTIASDDNVGFVPLLYIAGRYQISPKWELSGDIEGLAGGPGRAFDISLKARYTINEDWKLGLGYRTLEGGVDNDEVYNFAWFNSLLLSLDYRF